MAFENQVSTKSLFGILICTLLSPLLTFFTIYCRVLGPNWNLFYMCQVGRSLNGVKISGISGIKTVTKFVEFNGVMIQEREIYRISLQNETDGQKFKWVRSLYLLPVYLGR